jgi:hypothetical protein
MSGENGGELAGFLGEMLMGGLEALASGREGRGERRDGRPAGLEALGQIAAHRIPEMPEYFKMGAPYGPTNEGMMRWVSERAAAATTAAAERLAAVASPPMQAALRARNSAAESERIRSFAEGDQIRSFAEGERIRSFAGE